MSGVGGLLTEKRLGQLSYAQEFFGGSPLWVVFPGPPWNGGGPDFYKAVFHTELKSVFLYSCPRWISLLHEMPLALWSSGQNCPSNAMPRASNQATLEATVQPLGFCLFLVSYTAPRLKMSYTNILLAQVTHCQNPISSHLHHATWRWGKAQMAPRTIAMLWKDTLSIQSCPVYLSQCSKQLSLLKWRVCIFLQ